MMNKCERVIYNLVKKQPAIKFFIRNLYQAIFDILPRKKTEFINHIVLRDNYFYGFHDKSPFSKDSKKLLANHILIPLRMPQKKEKLEVGYFDILDGDFEKYVVLGSSSAWNYHKGCRLQWLNDNEIIYNSIIDNKLVATTIDLYTRDEKIVNYPIDTVSYDGKYATSFSYERLNLLMPGYGYMCSDESFLNDKAPSLTGLFIVDINSNSSTLLVNLFDLANDVDLNRDFKHYVTHSEFSYDGKYISFLHRWVGEDTRKRHSRLIIYDLSNDQYFALPTEDMVSHYVWNRKNQIIAYCRINSIESHILFNIENNITYDIIARQLNSDGHQSFINDESFVTDTYPDRRRMSYIYKVNIRNRHVERIASVYSPKKFQTKDFNKHIACDLHPRMSIDGKYICFDTAFTGKRSIAMMKMK